MKPQTLLLVAALTGLTGCKKDEPLPPARPIAPKPAVIPAPSPATPLPGTTPMTGQDPAAVINMETVGLDMALQSFVRAKGRLPKSVQEMVTEKFVVVVPPAPAGKKYVIDAQAKRVALVAQ